MSFSISFTVNTVCSSPEISSKSPLQSPEDKAEWLWSCSWDFSSRERQNALFHPHILLNMYLYLISPSKLPHPMLSTREQVWFLRLGLEKNPLEQNFQLSFRFVLFSLPQQVTFADEVLVLHQLWQLERKVSRKHQVSCLKTAPKVKNKTKWNYKKMLRWNLGQLQ